jgi:hypothetical protein
VLPAYTEGINRHFVLLGLQESAELATWIHKDDEIHLDIEMPRLAAFSQRYLRCCGRVAFVRPSGEALCSVGVTVERMQFSATSMRAPILSEASTPIQAELGKGATV